MDSNGHADSLSRDALRHLWLHFTGMGDLDPDELQIIVRGEGCYLEDEHGRRYLDALAGLFCVNAGYSYGAEMGEAAASQMRELPFAINWTFAHPRSIELAAELARLAPGDINRAFFVSGGSEAVEAAWKLARQYHSARGERRWKAIARRVAYHGTTMGALSINGCTELRTPFEPLVPDVLHVSNTNRYRRPEGESDEEFTGLLLDELEETIPQAGPETVAMVIMEPVQNAGGSFMPPAGYWAGVREALRPLRHPALRRRGDHGLRPPRPLVRVGALRHPARHDHDGEGAVLRLRGDRRPARERPRDGAVRAARLDVHPRHDLRRPPGAGGRGAQEHRDHAPRAASSRTSPSARTSSTPPSAGCSSSRSSATCAAAATSTRSSSSRTRTRRESFSDDECDELLRGFLSPELFKRGLICRADDRGDPVVQISPPLVAGPDEFEEIVQILGGALDEACDRMAVAR